MSSSLMLPDRSTASSRSRPACGGCTVSPSYCGRAAAMHEQAPSRAARSAMRSARAPATRGRVRWREARAVRHVAARSPIELRARGSSARTSHGSGNASSSQGQAKPSIIGAPARPMRASADRVRAAMPCQEARRARRVAARRLRVDDVAAGSRRRASAASDAVAANSGVATAGSRNASQSSPCSAAASGSRRRAARRSSSRHRSRGDRRRRCVACSARCASNRRTMRVATRRFARSATPARRTGDRRSQHDAASSHQPGAGGHHDGAAADGCRAGTRPRRSCVTRGLLRAEQRQRSDAPQSRRAIEIDARARRVRAVAAQRGVDARREKRSRHAPRAARRRRDRVRRVRDRADALTQAARRRRRGFERIAEQQHDQLRCARQLPASGRLRHRRAEPIGQHDQARCPDAAGAAARSSATSSPASSRGRLRVPAHQRVEHAQRAARPAAGWHLARSLPLPNASAPMRSPSRTRAPGERSQPARAACTDLEAHAGAEIHAPASSHRRRTA